MRKVRDTNFSFGSKLNDSEVRHKELLDDMKIFKKMSEEFKIHRVRNSRFSIILFLNNSELYLMHKIQTLEVAQLMRIINSKPRGVSISFHKPRTARHVSAIVRANYCAIDITQVLLLAGPKPKAHWLLGQIISSSTHCSYCASLMVGLIRQSYGLEVCSFTCYVSCKDSVPKIHSISRPSQRPLGVDMQKGIGTPYV